MTQSERYRVKLERALPSCLPAPFMVRRSHDELFKLADELVTACGAPAQPKSESHKEVQRMQLVCTMTRLCELARRRGVCPERLADKDCDVWHGKFRDCGNIQKKLKGMNPPNPATMRVFTQQLAKLYSSVDPVTLEDPYESQIDFYYNQAIWRALLLEPISGVAARLYRAHEMDCIPSIYFEHKDLIAGLPEAYSECVNPLHACWEHFANCITLMRELAEQGKTDLANSVARTVCSNLTMLGPEFQARGIGAAMFNYCCDHILPIVGINLHPICLARASALLNTLTLTTDCKSSKVAVSWGVRQYVMACVYLKPKSTALLKICDPQSYVNDYPAPDAWAQVLEKEIEVESARYPFRGTDTLNLRNVVLDHPEVQAWAELATAAAVPLEPKPLQARSIWDGLGTRD